MFLMQMFQVPNWKRVVRDPFVCPHTENVARKKSQFESPQFKHGEQPFPGEQKLWRDVLQCVRGSKLPEQPVPKDGGPQ